MPEGAPLYDPARDAPIDPRDAVRAARDFLLRCRAWGADREIPRRLASLADDPTPDKAAGLHAWGALDEGLHPHALQAGADQAIRIVQKADHEVKAAQMLCQRFINGRVLCE